VRNIFAWSRTEQLWRCSKGGTPVVKIWEEEKYMLVWLSKIVLAPAFFHMMLRLAKGTIEPNTCY